MNTGYPGLLALTKTIENRKNAEADKSYTSSLLQKGMKAIGSKVMEEAREFVTAAHDMETIEPDGVPSGSEATVEEAEELRSHLVYEAADLLYHSMVMLAHYDLSLADVEQELQRRFGTSGLDEKAARKKT